MNAYILLGVNLKTSEIEKCRETYTEILFEDFIFYFIRNTERIFEKNY